MRLDLNLKSITQYYFYRAIFLEKKVSWVLYSALFWSWEALFKAFLDLNNLLSKRKLIFEIFIIIILISDLSLSLLSGKAVSAGSPRLR